MHRRSRYVAVLTLALVLGQLGVAQGAPASDCLLLCTSTPTPTTSTTDAPDTPTPTPSTSLSTSPTSSPTGTPTSTPTSTPTGSPTPTSTPTTINGPDVASYQHPATAAYPNGKPINWNAVASAGMSFAIVKATESTSYTNPFFANDYAGALAAGLVHGAYHFARPAYPLNKTAMAQAAYFANQIGAVNTPSTLPPTLDLEVTGGLPRADLVTWAQIFLYRLRTLTGRTPMLYTYPSFWTSVLADPSAFSRFPLWMASYGSTAPTAELWQYTDSATINGISGNVDESTFLGTGGLPWATLSDGTAAVPWPTAVPQAPHAVTAVPGPLTATVSWVPGNSGSARTSSYVVTSSPGGFTATVGGASNSATVTGLDPTTSYTFTVTAVSPAGSGRPSAATAAVTPIVPTQLAIVQPSAINYGKALSISAVLSRTDTTKPTPVASESVTVLRKAPGAKTWRTFATTQTAADGSIHVRLHPPRAVQVELQFKGDSGYAASSATATTVVHAVVTAALSRPTVKHGKFVKLTGTVAPLISGEQVMLEQKINGKWRTGPIKKVNAKGRFTYRVKGLKKKTTQTYQVFVSPGHGLASGTSAPAVLTVT